MASSTFSFHHYPRRLLHTDTEPQWFASSDHERKSLDTLERQERALRARLRAAVLPELAADPIGVAGAADDRHRQFVLSQLHRDNSKVDPTEKPAAGGGAAISFWDKYRPRYEELLQQQHQHQHQQHQRQEQQEDQQEDQDEEQHEEEDADEASTMEQEQEKQSPHLRTPPAKPSFSSSSRFRLSLESSAGSAMSLGDD